MQVVTSRIALLFHSILYGVCVLYSKEWRNSVMQKKHEEKVMESQTLLSDPEWSRIELED